MCPPNKAKTKYGFKQSNQPQGQRIARDIVQIIAQYHFLDQHCYGIRKLGTEKVPKIGIPQGGVWVFCGFHRAIKIGGFTDFQFTDFQFTDLLILDLSIY